jgi:hypothetical protein
MVPSFLKNGPLLSKERRTELAGGARSGLRVKTTNYLSFAGDRYGPQGQDANRFWQGACTSS